MLNPDVLFQFKKIYNLGSGSEALSYQQLRKKAETKVKRLIPLLSAISWPPACVYELASSASTCLI